MDNLINFLILGGALKNPHIIDAFRVIDRADFVPEEKRTEAYENYPIPIGYGQTISQPQTVAFMLEHLAPEEGNKILDVGSGSGWQTALLAHIVGPHGKIIALELIPELKELGEKNAEKYGFVSEGRAEFHALNAKDGFPLEAPFDRIIAAASLPVRLVGAHVVRLTWKTELKVGGRIVVPLGESIMLLKKKTDSLFEEHEFPGFLFVPFI